MAQTLDQILESSQARIGNVRRLIHDPEIVKMLPEYPTPADLNRAKRAVERKLEDDPAELDLQTYFKLHDILCELVPEWEAACRKAAND